LGLAIHVYKAEWEKFGRAAGPKRNQMMINANPDIKLCLVVHDDIDRSKGTADCLRRVRKAGIPVQFLKHGR